VCLLIASSSAASVIGQGLTKVGISAQEAVQVGRTTKSVYRRGVDIRTKLVFALVAVTLGSLAAFGMVMDDIADTMISEAAQDQLEGLAASGEDALESIVDGWQERVQLIASRTQLRVSLREYNITGESADAMRIGRILGDAATSVKSVAALAVFDTDQQLVVQIGLRADSTLDELSGESFPDAPDDVRFLGAYVTEHGVPRVAYSTQLTIDSEHVGYLFVLLNGNRLVDLTADTSGLGETGELMVVERDAAGPRTLHAVRHPIDGIDGGERGAILLDGEDDPALLALANEEGVFTEGLRDYRGEQVWAATRFVEETEWGLVVKFDANEKKATIDDFRGRLYTLALSLAGIGLLVAVFLGFRLSKPIHDLAGVANRIREGDLDARAHRTREDEIGLLAHTFNDMAAELQVRMAELHEYHKFFDVSLDLLCIAGTDGFFKRTNPAFTRALGWTEEQLVSKPFLDLVHPDDIEPTQNEIEKLARGVPTISFLNRFKRADGSWVYLRWNSYPDPETGLLYAIARQIEDPQDA
jgi:PAS domain S-box-containing protein